MVGFFHPYANSCGGGEKVLWGAVQGLQEIAEYALLLERNAKIPPDPLRHLYRR